TLTAGQIGEETAKYYYQTFEKKFDKENIGSFKVNNSDNGIDILCNGDPVIIHESKNYSDSLFHLSTSSTGLQCSKKWLSSHFSEMLLSMEKDKKSIKLAEDSKLENTDPIISEIIKQKRESVNFNGKVIATLNIKKKNNSINFNKAN